MQIGFDVTGRWGKPETATVEEQISVFGPKMVLGTSWGYLGLLLGALGGLLGVTWDPVGGSRSSRRLLLELLWLILTSLSYPCCLDSGFFLTFAASNSFLYSFFRICRMSRLTASVLITNRKTSQLKTLFLKSENLRFCCF